MDQSLSFRRSIQLSPDPTPWIAAAAVAQAATRTAVLAERMYKDRELMGDALGALVAVFSAHDAGAAMLLQGSFHPRIAAGRDVADRPAKVKGPLTFAF